MERSNLPTVERWPSRARTIAVLAVLVLAGLALRVLCYSGLGTSDPLGYIAAAANLARGVYPWHEYPGAYAGVGLIVPITPLVMLGGYTSWLPSLYSLACGLGLILVTYWLGVQLMRGSTGLWAAFVVAFSTLAIGTAMAVLPDTPLAFWSALAVALAVDAQRNADRRRTFLLCFAAAIALGIAWSTKITAVFVFPVVFLALLPMTGRRAVALAGGCAGLLLMLLVYAGFWALATGDPWDGLRCISGGLPADDTGAVSLPPRHSLWAYPIKMFIIVSDDGLFYYFLVPAMLWAVACKWRELWLPIAWVAIVFLCLQFGTTSLSTYRPFPHNARYLMLLLPAGAVLIGAAFAHLAAKRPRSAGALGAGYAMVCGFLAFLHPATMSSDVPAAAAAMRLLEGERPDAVFTDRQFARRFNHVQLDFAETVPPAEVWLDENLEPVRAPIGEGSTFVVRYDGSVQRYHATQGNYEPLDVDAAYAWLERNADKRVVELDHACLQRPALAVIDWVVDRIPFPAMLASRLDTTLSRHLARRVVVIYRVGGTATDSSTGSQNVVNP